MARQRWVPIAIPDISDSAIRAQQASGLALNQALGGLSGVVDQYRAQQREADLAELFARQNAFAAGNDVTGYQAAIASGALTQGLGNLRANDIAAARSFTGDLRTARNADTTFERGQVIAGRQDAEYARSEADRETGLFVAREANKIQADLAEGRITQAEADDRAYRLSQATQNAGQINAAFVAPRQGLADSQARTRWDREGILFNDQRQDRADQRQAQALIEKYQGLGGTFDDLEASEEWPQMNPQVRALARQAWGASARPGAFAGVASDVTAAQAEVASHLQSQGATPAAIAGIMGNFEHEGGWGGAQGDGGSASGIAQWRNERRAAFKARYGKDPHQATPQEQAQFVVWELLSPEGRKVSGVTQEQARQIWTATDPGRAAELFDQYYERSDGKTRAARAASARRFAAPSAAQNQAAVNRTTTAAETQMGTDGMNWMVDLPKAFADNSSLPAVLERVTSGAKRADGSVSPLAGQSQRVVQSEIERVQREYRKMHKGKTLRPAAAALILEQSSELYDGLDPLNLTKRPLSGALSAVPGVFGRLPNPVIGPFSGGAPQYAVDRNKVKDYLSQIKFDREGNVIGLSDTVTSTQNNRAVIANSAAALQQVETLRAELAAQQAKDRAARRFDNPVTARLEARYIAAQRALDAINSAGASSSRAASGR